MRKFAANISILFTECPFIDRFAAARAAGFEAVECWFPYECSETELRQALRDSRLKLIGINTPPGNDDEWGHAALPGREADFRAGFGLALDYARALDVPAIHILGGMIGGTDGDAAEGTYRQNLRYAHDQSAGDGLRLLIEPLNSTDRPGYFLSSVEHAASLVTKMGLDRLKILFDCYHVQMEDGNLTGRLRSLFPLIGHIQIAAVPDRGEPDQGEIDYRFVLDQLAKLGWDGWIGAEYKPRTGTSDGLKWRERLS